MRMFMRGSGALAAGAVLSLAGVASADVGIGTIEIEGTPVERPNPLAWLVGADAQPTLRDVLAQFDEAIERDDVDAVVVRLKDAALPTWQTEEIGAAMKRLRDAGKRVTVFSEAYGTDELLLASYADEALIQSGSSVMFPGIYMQEIYLADTLAMIGMKADFVQVGDYKGASEPLARSEPSPEWDENITGLLDGMYAELRRPIKDGRRLSDKALDRAMEQAWYGSDKTGVETGLIDGALDLPDLGDHLESVFGEPVAWREIAVGSGGALQMDTANPFAVLSLFMQEPNTSPRRATIALIHIDGAIVDGDSQTGLFGGQSVGSRTIRRALRDLENNDLVKGVIVRVDSPGGSATASEVIWQGIRRVAAKKPVWTSVGGMAASGGYYIGVAGDKIYANPSSIVGSIGVVGGKITMGGMFDMIDLNVVSRSRGPMASMFATDAPWTDEQRSFVREKMTETYDLFTERVSAGRRGIDLSKTAEGRLFVGAEALDLRMVDKVGGLEVAIGDMADTLGLDAGGYDVMHFPGQMSLEDFLNEMFGASVTARADSPLDGLLKRQLGSLAEELLGEQGWGAVRQSGDAIMQMRREPVLLVDPRVLIVR